MKLALWIAGSALLAALAGAWTLRRAFDGWWHIVADLLEDAPEVRG